MSGEKTALEIALAESGVAEPWLTQVEQLELLGLPVSQKVIDLDKARESKIGRPLNARNRRTVEMAAYLLSRYTSPLEVLAQIASTRTDVLADGLGCSKLEALQERRLAAIALKDHLHSKMPVAVDLTTHKIIHLTLEDPAAPAAASEGDDAVTLTGTILSQRYADEK